LLSVNAFFITRLVSKIDEAHMAAGNAETAARESQEKLKGLERVIREITELKSDMQLFKYVMVNNLGVKLPEKKEGNSI
jgi:t-SNARE complex subunit (syntaxin)